MVSPFWMSATFVRQSSWPLLRVDRDGVAVEQVQEQLAVRIECAAVDGPQQATPLEAAAGLGL